MDELLTGLKSRLHITWDDEDTDLEKIIKRAKAYFKRLTGKSFSFGPEDDETELLYERCRYVYNNAVDEFELNFDKELKRLILDVALEKRKEG
ncbi:phage head-tail connector protein [Metasolibacillus meyeri]|uniref:phage head-tail connector protein n=1 Tax=Metasolibacillus meyeri TaxID=1071052 RepID=UPI000D30F10A|nr:phage head-tail connector protein [Metasolibacillus meyeri]